MQLRAANYGRTALELELDLSAEGTAVEPSALSSCVLWFDELAYTPRLVDVDSTVSHEPGPGPRALRARLRFELSRSLRREASLQCYDLPCATKAGRCTTTLSLTVPPRPREPKA